MWFVYICFVLREVVTPHIDEVAVFHPLSDSKNKAFLLDYATITYSSFSRKYKQFK